MRYYLPDEQPNNDIFKITILTILNQNDAFHILIEWLQLSSFIKILEILFDSVFKSISGDVSI